MRHREQRPHAGLVLDQRGGSRATEAASTRRADGPASNDRLRNASTCASRDRRPSPRPSSGNRLATSNCSTSFSTRRSNDAIRPGDNTPDHAYDRGSESYRAERPRGLRLGTIGKFAGASGAADVERGKPHEPGTEWGVKARPATRRRASRHRRRPVFRAQRGAASPGSRPSFVDRYAARQRPVAHDIDRLGVRSGSLLYSPTVLYTVWYGYAVARSFSYFCCLVPVSPARLCHTVPGCVVLYRKPSIAHGSHIGPLGRGARPDWFYPRPPGARRMAYASEHQRPADSGLNLGLSLLKTRA